MNNKTYTIWTVVKNIVDRNSAESEEPRLTPFASKNQAREYARRYASEVETTVEVEGFEVLESNVDKVNQEDYYVETKADLYQWSIVPMTITKELMEELLRIEANKLSPAVRAGRLDRLVREFFARDDEWLTFSEEALRDRCREFERYLKTMDELLYEQLEADEVKLHFNKFVTAFLTHNRGTVILDKLIRLVGYPKSAETIQEIVKRESKMAYWWITKYYPTMWQQIATHFQMTKLQLALKANDLGYFRKSDKIGYVLNIIYDPMIKQAIELAREWYRTDTSRLPSEMILHGPSISCREDFAKWIHDFYLEFYRDIPGVYLEDAFDMFVAEKVLEIQTPKKLRLPELQLLAYRKGINPAGKRKADLYELIFEDT